MAYLMLPDGLTVLTACTAATAMEEKCASSAPMILDDMQVLAALRSVSLPRVSVSMAIVLVINLHA